MAIKVTVWNEYLHEKQFEEVAAIYPKGITAASRSFSKRRGWKQKRQRSRSRSTA